MEDITLVEFIWKISEIIGNWFCNIKLKDYLFFVVAFLGWKLIHYLLFEKTYKIKGE